MFKEDCMKVMACPVRMLRRGITAKKLKIRNHCKEAENQRETG